MNVDESSLLTNGGDIPVGITDIPNDFPAQLISLRRHLHMHPELGYKEVKTSAYLRNKLESHGLHVQGPIAETGLFVDIEGALPGPFVGYRADIDALPIQDAKQVPYASQNTGIAHLCGHDAHSTVAIGVALLLHASRDRLQGRVRVFFQPNEEGTPSGSIAMIKSGVLDGLEAVYCIHVDPTLPVGQYGLITGAVTAAADKITIQVRGRSTGHSARPHQTRDTIWIATQVLNLIYQYVGRVTDARHAAVLTICRFQGGHAHNVIPSFVEMEGTLRCTDAEDRAFIKKYIRHTVEELAALHDVAITVSFSRGVPAVNNDGRLVETVRSTIHQLYDRTAVFDIPVPSMGSEDFANYLEYVPGILVRVGTSSSDRTSHPLHDASFDIDEASLAPAAQVMASTLINHLARRPLG